MALTKVSFSMIQDGSVNVRDFGAACDWNGSTGTDDTVAIQAAIDYGIANHKAVFFPAMCKITASLIVPGDTRGLYLYGVDKRNTGIYNANTSSADALAIGDNVDLCYDITIRDLRIEGNGSCGKGLAIFSANYCFIENVFVEFVGSHGFWLQNVGQSTIINTHARRCAYNSGSTSVAGLSVQGLFGYSIFNHTSEECAVGIWANNTSLVLDGVVVNDNQNGGIRLVGASLLNAVNTYSEQTFGGNNDWYIGDGTNAISYAFIRNCATGNATYMRFNKVKYYEIDQMDLRGSGTGEIYIVDPNYSRGTIKGIYAGGADTLGSDSATVIQHCPSNPIKLTTFNNLLGDNGSFEQDLTTNWTKDWIGAIGTVAVTDVAGLGYDVGTHACQFIVSSSPSTYYVRPTYPTTKAGRFYALEFDYFSNGTLLATCTTGGVRHFNFVLPTTSAEGMHYRIVFFAQGTINTLEFQAQANGTYKLDGVILYEGLYGLN